jgi:hypothetical protein
MAFWTNDTDQSAIWCVMPVLDQVQDDGSGIQASLPFKFWNKWPIRRTVAPENKVWTVPGLSDPKAHLNRK